MLREIVRRIGRRGATVAAVAAFAVAGVGLSGGVANAAANYWYWFNNHPTGHGVGLYSEPQSESPSFKVDADMISTPSSTDAVYLACWADGEDINGQGDVWYQVTIAYYGSGQADNLTAYIYGAYADGNWNYDSLTLTKECPGY